MVPELAPVPNSTSLTIRLAGRVVGTIEAAHAHLIQGAVLASWSAASPMTVDELEQADDFAHTSGRAKALERARRNMPADNGAQMAALMVQTWRERAKRCREDLNTLKGLIRYFRHNPEVYRTKFEGIEWTEDSAWKEFRFARDQHRKCCNQMRMYLRQQAAQQPAPTETPALALPPAANDAAQAAGKVA